jgi:hypothetical protein
LDEFEDIRLTGELRAGSNSVEGKHLTGSLDEAVCFASKLYPDGRFRIVTVEVADNVAGRFFAIGRIDGCGRAWFAEIEELRGCIIGEVTP